MAAALQDAGALTENYRMARSVLECASPLALCSVTALGKDLRTAQAAAYAAVECIRLEGAHFRRDIAAKAF
jgi:phosphoribosylamine-glycine ligase